MIRKVRDDIRYVNEGDPIPQDGGEVRVRAKKKPVINPSNGDVMENLFDGTKADNNHLEEMLRLSKKFGNLTIPQMISRIEELEKRVVELEGLIGDINAKKT